jgi:serine/threonine protein kinase
MPYIASLFHDALLGLNFLHSHNWVHGDLKPSNIGILDKGSPHVVLLDLEGAVNIQPGKLLPATPGRGGTVNYLAPERELQAHDCLIDVWSMGVVGFEILHGYHPWKLALNPWRSGSQFEALQPTFHKMYHEAVHTMKHHLNAECRTHLF